MPQRPRVETRRSLHKIDADDPALGPGDRMRELAPSGADVENSPESRVKGKDRACDQFGSDVQRGTKVIGRSLTGRDESTRAKERLSPGRGPRQSGDRLCKLGGRHRCTLRIAPAPGNCARTITLPAWLLPIAPRACGSA